MPLETKIVQPFDKDHEQDMWDGLCAGFRSRYKEDGKFRLLLGNFSCEKQFDALYLAPNAACILELKSHSGFLHAPQNDVWHVDETEVKASGGVNPFFQVQRCKFALADRMRTRWANAFDGAEQPNWLYSNGRTVFNPPIYWDNELDHKTRCWFDVKDLETVVSDLLELEVATFDLSEEQIRFVVDSLLGSPARSSKSRCLYFHQSDFNESLRRVQASQGEAQLASNIFKGYYRRLAAGQSPLADVKFDEHPEIEGLRAHRITNNYRLLVVNHHGQNYLVLIGTEAAAKEWIDANHGLVYTVDIESRKIRTTRVSVQEIDASTAITAENIPFAERVAEELETAKVPQEAIAPLASLDEDSSPEDREAAMESISDLAFRDAMHDAFELMRVGKEAEAQARIKLYGGQSIPVADAPALQEAAVGSIENSEELIDLGELDPEDFKRFMQSLEDESWMYFLHPGQKRVVDEDHPKPAILTGVSGSGKTAVMMHRARRLAAKHPEENVLVLTLNKNLARMISLNMERFCGAELMGRISVMAFHDYLAKILARSNIRGFLEDFAAYTGQSEAMQRLLVEIPQDELPRLFQSLDESDLREFFADFTSHLQGDDRATFLNMEVFLQSQSKDLDTEAYIYEELELVRSAFPCFDDYGAYLTDFERQGRAIGLQRGRKEQVLDLLKLWERYQIQFRFFDHMGLAQAAYLAVEEARGIPDEFRYRCVLVDEFQDFSNLELKILARIPTHPENGLFMTGDIAQKLYAKQLNLTEAGLGPDDRVLRFILKNYRNSRQILAAADNLITRWPVLAGKDSDLKILRPELAKRETSSPAAYRTDDPVLAAWRDVATSITEYGYPSQGVCIISANTAKYPLEDIVECRPDGLQASELAGWAGGDMRTVPVSDIASVKGFEFKMVFIVGLEEGSFPSAGRFKGEIWRDAQRLYVAMTRGMNEVRMYYNGRPSMMLEAMGESIEFLDAKPVATNQSPTQEPQEPVTPPVEKVAAAEPPPRVIPEAVVQNACTEGAFYTLSVQNGLRFLLLRREPSQMELARITSASPAHVSNLLFQDHQLALVPHSHLSRHLVISICNTLGFVAEFRDPVPVSSPSTVAATVSLPRVQVLPVEVIAPINVPEEGIQIGPLLLETLVYEKTDYRAPFGERDLVQAYIKEYPLKGEDGFDLMLHDVRLEGGDRYITCGANNTGDEYWNRLVNRLRLGAKQLDGGDWIIELRQARLKTGTWSTRFGATADQLEQGAGMDVLAMLHKLGAVRTGTKQAVYGETNRTGGRLCARFAAENTAVPLATYVVTTVLPLINRYTQADAMYSGDLI